MTSNDGTYCFTRNQYEWVNETSGHSRLTEAVLRHLLAVSLLLHQRQAQWLFAALLQRQALAAELF